MVFVGIYIQLQNIIAKLEMSEEERTDLALLCARCSYKNATVDLCKSAKSPEKLFIEIAVSDVLAKESVSINFYTP